jgi:peptidoglycan hydrolase-like protein with peptidoglycan-binding domain
MAPLTAQPAPPPVDRLLPRSVRAVQARLRALGCYSGAGDGVWGQGTAVAIEHFPRGRGLRPGGHLGPATGIAIGLAPDELAYR